ncbi:aspartic proteinase nepenthesin-1 [Ziziphus jujuba]|uniref:Aspartic proteinase nepenthesin-1 n=2 Tax=Ziziphus jujuba TaxID=326968 RepID=A0A6P4AXL6_ZIZJJ|nr:aspartic proteinase nepenthesin-1 [Ziziphus jujuba]KAH7520568.1 hypothetical protein FEM48_Zijuj08G0158400 [Ziziphus jujuba var. spinosa]
MAFFLYSSSINPLVIPLVLVLLFLALFSIPATSTSRKVVVQNHNSKNHQITGFKVSLKHVDYGKNLTSFQRLQRGIKRGKQRLQRLNAMVLADKTSSSSTDSSAVESPVNAGNGEFLMKLAIGTPPLAYSAIMDTGSDLIWTQCSPCKDCFSQSTDIFNPKKSTSYSNLPCSSELCTALPSSTCSDGCEYYYAYGDYSSTQGQLATETFTFGESDAEVSVPNIGFGCGEDNEGDGFNQGAGLVGLGRGPLSLVSQLKEPKFSYCLNSIDDSKSSSLLLGSLANLNGSTSSHAIKTTPLVQNPSQPSFYYLSLQGITVGEERLPISKDTFSLQDDGSGGLIIDSGTTITYLEESAYDELRKVFSSKVNLPVDDSGSEGLDLCFKLPSDSSKVDVPKLIFHFDGADLDFPPENYVLLDSDLGLLCLAMGASSGMSILGNFQQQNTLVLHDLQKETLSFVPTKCEQL